MRERAGLIMSYLLAARSLSQPFRVANYRLKVVGSRTVSLQSLVTHNDPITTAMPMAGSVEVGMSTSKEVQARMTSLGKQTYTPHGWEEEALISWAVGGCLGEDRLGRGWREEERNLGLQKQG